MTIFNINQEWKFIIAETHKKKFRKNLIKREILFGLQILLCRMEKNNYSSLKKIYCLEN